MRSVEGVRALRVRANSARRLPHLWSSTRILVHRTERANAFRPSANCAGAGLRALLGMEGRVVVDVKRFGVVQVAPRLPTQHGATPYANRWLRARGVARSAEGGVRGA